MDERRPRTIELAAVDELDVERLRDAAAEEHELPTRLEQRQGVAERGRRGQQRAGEQLARRAAAQAAGARAVVGQQPPHRSGLVGLHQRQQLVAPRVGEGAEEVGGVVRIHGVEDVAHVLVVERREQACGVLVLHLLERVGCPFLVERGEQARRLGRVQLEQRLGDVGGPAPWRAGPRGWRRSRRR